MIKKTFIFPIFVLSSIILISHSAATYFYLYWMTPWIDIPNHLLGGAIVSLIFWSLAFRLKTDFFTNNSRFFSLFIGLIVGFLWEVFELHYSITSMGAPGYFADSSLDILNSIVGVFIAFYFFIKPEIENDTE